jgi:hypothetical protein
MVLNVASTHIGHFATKTKGKTVAKYLQGIKHKKEQIEKAVLTEHTLFTWESCNAWVDSKRAFEFHQCQKQIRRETPGPDCADRAAKR